MSEPTTFYELLNGEATVQKIVAHFYQKMDSDSRFTEIRNLHPKKLHVSESKLFDFLSGWLGGPPLYMNKYGHPRLRMRHLPFKIGETERDQWMTCMIESLHDLKIDEMLESDVFEALKSSFFKTADFMKNI